MTDIKLADGEISFSQWSDRYLPEENHLVTGNELMFETYGEQLDYVSSLNRHYVWTYVQGEMSMILVAGMGYVDRLGYYVTEKPWTDENEVVVLSIETECECFDPDTEEGNESCQTCEGYGLKTIYVE